MQFTLLSFLLLCVRPTTLGALRATLHIGQGKAASNYLQDTLRVSEAALAKVNYLVHAHTAAWRIFNETEPLLTEWETSDLILKINKSRRMNHDIIYSCESLSTLDHDGILRLRDAFDGFDIRIVFVYRESLSRVKSMFNQMVKKYRHYHVSEYVFQHLINTGDEELLGVLNKYSDVFGRDNISVLDMYGAIAAGKDIADVFLCEIVQVSYCEIDGENGKSKLPAINIDRKSNPSCDWMAVLVVEEIIVYASMYWGCEGQRIHHMIIHQQMVSSLRAALPEHPPTISTTSATNTASSISLSALVEAAEEIDKRLRIQYSNRILYGDSSANAVVRNEVTLPAINRTAFWHNDPFWSNWVREQAAKLQKEQFFAYCNATIE